MAYRLREDYVFIGEGAADNALMRKLSLARGLPSFDYPFPDGIRRKKEDTACKKKDTVGEKDDTVGGKGSFGEMLKLLEPVAYEQHRPRGILIATDCGDDWETAFANVADQVAGTRFYPLPEKPGQPVSATPASSHLPPLVIVMVPGEGKTGGMETLLVEALRAKHSKTAECLEQYLACLDGKGVGIKTWGQEKQGKARLQCLIAVTNKIDPNKGPSRIFSDQKNNNPPVIDVMHPAFDALAKDLEKAVAAL